MMIPCRRCETPIWHNTEFELCNSNPACSAEKARLRKGYSGDGWSGLNTVSKTLARRAKCKECGLPLNGYAPEGICGRPACKALRNQGPVRATKEWIRAFKLGKKCADCGLGCDEGNFPVFDWDHRPGVEKVRSVSQMIGWPHVAVLAEIAKCDLRCSNCHRLVTHNRRVPPGR